MSVFPCILDKPIDLSPYFPQGHLRPSLSVGIGSALGSSHPCDSQIPNFLSQTRLGKTLIKSPVMRDNEGPSGAGKSHFPASGSSVSPWLGPVGFLGSEQAGLGAGVVLVFFLGKCAPLCRVSAGSFVPAGLPSTACPRHNNSQFFGISPFPGVPRSSPKRTNPSAGLSKKRGEKTEKTAAGCYEGRRSSL